MLSLNDSEVFDHQSQFNSSSFCLVNIVGITRFSEAEIFVFSSFHQPVV